MRIARSFALVLPVAIVLASWSGWASGLHGRAAASIFLDARSSADELVTRIPDVVYGHRLHRAPGGGGGSVSPGMLAMLAALGREPGDLAMAVAFDPTGESDLRVSAVRVTGIDARQVLAGWLNLQYANLDYHRQERTMGDRAATCIKLVLSSTAFCYVARADVLFIVASGEFLLVREAVLRLP
jgi:hypothetical protein